MKNENIVVLKELLFRKKNIVIIPHTNPDGDAIGSSLALMHLLNSIDHNSTVISPNKAPYFLKWSPGFENIIYFDSDKNSCLKLIENADLIFTLDFNDLDRIGEMSKYVDSSNAKIILIDHHLNPKDYADLVFSDIEIGSTCELLFESGSFQYSSVTSRTHEIISKLIRKGINQSDIHNKVYNNSSISRLKVLSSALSNLNVLKELNTVYMYLKRDDLKKFDFQKGDSEGIVNYGLSLKNIIFSVMFIEDINDENNIKISFRSQDGFSCNEFANKHFNGGGHANAAGGRDDGPIEETIHKFKKLINQYKDNLITNK